MNTETSDKLKNKDEPYSISSFSDLISSPVFLAILLLTFILGLSSVFGFFQNPQKLRLIIELINQRVNISETKNHQEPNAAISSYVKNSYPETLKDLHTVYRRNGNITASSLDVERYSILADYQIIDKQSNDIIILSFKHLLNGDFYTETIAKQDSTPRYWHNLKRLSPDEAIIGSPLSPYYSLDKENSRYLLNEVLHKSYKIFL